MSFQKLLEQPFDVLDPQHTGFITMQSARKFCSTFGLSSGTLQEFFEYCDVEGEGKISKDQFASAVRRRKARRVSHNDVKTLYNRMDPTGKNRLERDMFILHMKPLNEEWTDSQLKKLFKQYDSQKKGYLNKDQFESLIRANI